MNNDASKDLNVNSMSKSILTNDEVVNLSVMLFLAGKVVQSCKSRWMYYNAHTV